MGGYIAKLLNSFSDMKAKILMLGLDGAGKTTVLYQMKLHENVHSVPTIGFNVE
jgi:ADP-ribosylation factor protein 1